MAIMPDKDDDGSRIVGDEDLNQDANKAESPNGKPNDAPAAPPADDDEFDEQRRQGAKLDDGANVESLSFDDGKRKKKKNSNDRPESANPDEYIQWLNETYAAITLNGKFKIFHEKKDGTIEFLDKKSFIDKFEHMRFSIKSAEDEKVTPVPLTTIWLRSNLRRMYQGITFDPSRVGHYDDNYNLFNGWSIEPIEKDIGPWTDMVKNIICSGDEDNLLFLDALIEQMIKEPHAKPGVAVVIRGDEGVGKSFFIEKLCALVAPYYFKTSNPAYIFGDHNGQLKNTILLHLEEAVWGAGNKKDESLLKDLITGRTIEINDKYVPVYSVPNHLHLFITGNPLWLVSAGFQARRLFALHASEAHIRDTKYFAEFDEWFNDGGKEAILYYYLNKQKSKINLRKVPVTEELIEQKQQSMSGLADLVFSIADSKEMPYGEMNKETGHVQIIKALLLDHYNNSPAGKRRPLTDRKFGGEFLGLLPKANRNGAEVKFDNNIVTSVVGNDNDVRVNDGRGIRRPVYDIPRVSVIREALEFRLGGKCKWTTPIGDDSWTVLRKNTEFDFSPYKY